MIKIRIKKSLTGALIIGKKKLKNKRKGLLKNGKIPLSDIFFRVNHVSRGVCDPFSRSSANREETVSSVRKRILLCFLSVDWGGGKRLS
jgi:hypothetical protein